MTVTVYQPVIPAICYVSRVDWFGGSDIASQFTDEPAEKPLTWVNRRAAGQDFSL